tara:strand:- start:8553 stop:11498 length:2946 start_codon:yes stop_codon:yes gene_type:complete
MLGLNKGKLSIGEPIYRFDNNHSVDFDGVDDFIQLGQGFTYTQHTVSVWIKLGELSRTHTILSGRDSSTDLIRFWVASSDNKVRFRLGDGSNTTVTNPTALEANRWYHVVATYDGTNLNIYVDSVLGHSLAASKNVNVTANLKIGEDDSSNRFMGNIDELAIWDRALTAVEVTEIYRIKYGANLVQNGRFDELGNELVTNGDFSTNSDFIFIGDAEISGGTGNFTGTANSFIIQTSVIDASVKTYKLQYEVVESNGGLLKLAGGNSGFGTLVLTNTVGVHTIYLTSNGTKTSLQFNNASAFVGKIDNVSLKQVDPNDRFTLDTGWSYGDGVAICDGTNNADILQSGSVAGKTYRVNFTITENNAGRLSVFIGGQFINHTGTGNSGNFTFIGEAINSTLIRFKSANFNGSITNVMVEEQKYVATNLKLNSGNYKSADPVIVSTKSVDLDGGEEYLEVEDDASLRGLSNLTISTWLKLSSKSAFDKIIDYSGASGNVNRKYRLMLNTSASKFQFQIGDASGSGYSVSSTTDPDLNRWYNVICVFQGSGSNRLKIYVNGVLEASSSAADSVAEISNTADGNLRFGSNSYSVANLFHGKLDELGIFSSALSSDQVGELYNQGVPSNLLTSTAGQDGTLLGYWKMGDGTLDQAPLIADQTNATLGSEFIPQPVNLSNSPILTNGGGVINSSNQFETFGGTLDGIKTNELLTLGKTYKLIIEGNTTSSGFTVGNTTGSGNQYGSGFGTHYFVATDNTRIWIRQATAGVTTITNFSVKQVNGNPALMINTPTIVTDAPLTKIRNYYRMGDGILDEIQGDGSVINNTNGVICDMISPSLGTELITDGDFPLGTSAWTLGTGWSLQDGACVRSGTGTNSACQQSINITANKLYKVSYTRVYESGHKTTNLFSDFETDGTSITLGSYSGDDVTIKINSYFMPTYTGSVAVRVFGINDWTGKITNVSVKEVNGVAGKMTNMRDTDITNDVPS